MSRALVLACGNSLRGDDGVAIRIVNQLKNSVCDPGDRSLLPATVDSRTR